MIPKSQIPGPQRGPTFQPTLRAPTVGAHTCGGIFRPFFGLEGGPGFSEHRRARGYVHEKTSVDFNPFMQQGLPVHLQKNRLETIASHLFLTGRGSFSCFLCAAAAVLSVLLRCGFL